MITTADYPTSHGSQYLQQLCKHFGHKVEVSFTPTEGLAALPVGALTLRADEAGLHLSIDAPDAKSMIEARYVVDIHLVTFAHREGFAGLNWRMEDAPPGDATAS